MVCKRKQLQLLPLVAQNDPTVTSICIEGSIEVDQRLQSLAHALPGNSHLRHLQLDGARASSTSAALLSDGMNANKSLQSVTIRSNLNRYDQVREMPQFWDNLLLKIANHRRIQELKLENVVLSLCLQGFCNFVSSSKSLKKVSLLLTNDSYLNDTIKRELLVAALQNNQSLEELELVGGDVQTIEAFLQGLQGHKKLSCLKLSLDSSFYSSNAVVALTASVKTFLSNTCVRALELDCRDETLLEQLISILPHGQLHKFMVKSWHASVPNAVAQMLFLKELTIPEANQELMDVIASHPCLQVLEIGCIEHADLHETLVHNRHLKVLRLGKVQSTVYASMIKGLYESGSSSSNSLEEVALSNWQDDVATDHVLQACVAAGVARLHLYNCGRFNGDRMQLLFSNDNNKHSRLKELSLTRCPLDRGGAQVLARHLRKLKRLKLWYADIDTEVALLLIRMLLRANTTVYEFNMEYNPSIGVAAITELANGLPKLVSLRKLGFTWQPSYHGLLPELMEGFRNNTSLSTIIVSSVKREDLPPGNWHEQLACYQHRNRLHALLQTARDELVTDSLKPHVLAWFSQIDKESDLFQLIRKDLPPLWIQ
jgi:hypothetical protein